MRLEMAWCQERLLKEELKVTLVAVVQAPAVSQIHGEDDQQSVSRDIKHHHLFLLPTQ